MRVGDRRRDLPAAARFAAEAAEVRLLGKKAGQVRLCFGSF
jgi:hypothetical protein